MRIDRPTAIAMPGRTPSSATPRKATIERLNSTFRWRQSLAVAGTSASDSAAVITTAASADCGRFRNRPGRNTIMTMMRAAPVIPVSCDRDPARSATAVLEALVLTGKPWNRPAARLAAPMPIISWSPCTSWSVRAAKADAVEMVSASDTSAIATAPPASVARSDQSTLGTVSGGKPCGRTPIRLTPRSPSPSTALTTMADTTMTSTAGTFAHHRCRTRITAMPPRPTAAAAGTTSPCASPATKPVNSPMSPSASTENPNSFGSCPTMMVSASPFM